jgi:hypothetical protein
MLFVYLWEDILGEVTRIEAEAASVIQSRLNLKVEWIVIMLVLTTWYLMWMNFWSHQEIHSYQENYCIVSFSITVVVKFLLVIVDISSLEVKFFQKLSNILIM